MNNGDTMDYVTIIAFIVGALVVGGIYVIKKYKLENADRIASKTVAILQLTLSKYSKEIKEYDKENGTKYFQTLYDSLKEVEKMLADPEIGPFEFAIEVGLMSEKIMAILENVNLYDKVVGEE